MDNKENNFVSAVVYLHKEDTNIVGFLKMLYDTLEENFKKYEIICVNDMAGKYVVDAVKEFKKSHDDVIVSIVNMGFLQGLEASMNAGIDLCIGDFVFEFDSCYIDYDKNLIMEIYRKALEGYDIVTAVPPKSKSRISSRLFYFLYNKFSDSEKELMTSRFSVISRRTINRVSAYSKTIPYRKAIYASSGLNIMSMRYMDTKSSCRGGRPDDIKKNNTALDALVLFTNLAYKVSLTISVLMAFFMIVTSVYTVVAYFGQNKPVAGWAPIMGLVSAGFLGIFVIMTIIIKYLDILVRLVFKKQKYLVSSIEKL